MTKIYEAENYFLIHNGYTDPAAHRHHAAHVIISLDGEFFAWAGEREYRCKGLAIPSNVLHKINSNNSPMLVFLLDSSTSAAKNIKEPAVISDETAEIIAREYLEFTKTGSAQAYRKFESEFSHLLGFADFRCDVKDSRIISALEYIQNNLNDNLRCGDAAKAAGLSESRFSHLFKEQTGMTFAAYLVFRRLMCGYASIIKGTSITDAALDAGFSGSSHFADVNRRVFGISAAAITKDLQFKKMH